MPGIAVLFLVYAVVLIAGGARVKSAPSLISGSVSGVLAVFFLGRFQRTRKAMPAVPIVVLSVFMLAASLVQLGATLTHSHA